MTWFKNHSLYILLPAFILIGILALVREISVGHHTLYKAEGGEVTGTVAHRPLEFPNVFSFDPLQGLDSNAKGEIHVPRPPLSDDIFPCTQCHDKDMNNSKRRELTDEHVKIKLHHGDESRWCLDCHDFEDRDKLHLTSGEKISFEDSPRLCGQCHGDKYRDWKRGIHGKRTGYWNGPKRYLLCVNCHWPHDPHFKPLKPLPPPVRPEYIKTAPLGTPEPSASGDPDGGNGARVPTVRESGAPPAIPAGSPAASASAAPSGAAAPEPSSAASPAIAPSPAASSAAASAPSPSGADPSKAPTEAK